MSRVLSITRDKQLPQPRARGLNFGSKILSNSDGVSLLRQWHHGISRPSVELAYRLYLLSLRNQSGVQIFLAPHLGCCGHINPIAMGSLWKILATAGKAMCQTRGNEGHHATTLFIVSMVLFALDGSFACMLLRLAAYSRLTGNQCYAIYLPITQ